MRLLVRPMVVGGFALLSLGAVPAAARTTIPIRNTAFQKPSVTVSKGELVVWKDFQRFTKHSVASRGEPGFASSSLLEAGDEYSVRFKQAGEYRYVCKVHPSSMSGRIVVE